MILRLRNKEAPRSIYGLMRKTKSIRFSETRSVYSRKSSKTTGYGRKNSKSPRKKKIFKPVPQYLSSDSNASSEESFSKERSELKKRLKGEEVK